MHTVLLIFEFLGTTELLVIALVALVLFGPRKLPEISRSLGKSLAEFKRASDDFKRTWEYEVELERRKSALGDAEEPRPAVGESRSRGAAWGARSASAFSTPAGLSYLESDSKQPQRHRGTENRDEENSDNLFHLLC